MPMSVLMHLYYLKTKEPLNTEFLKNILLKLCLLNLCKNIKIKTSALSLYKKDSIVKMLAHQNKIKPCIQ